MAVGAQDSGLRTQDAPRMHRDGDHAGDGWAVLVGDAAERLRELPDGCAQCCVTSPPYWGLRDYGVDGQVGREATPEEYVERMVGIFREVRRVLRDDGTLWLNLGDSYTAQGSGAQGASGERAGRRHTQRTLRVGASANRGNGGSDFDGPHRRGAGLPPKSLVGIPWRVALALQADGWTLRSEIIWHKPAPMPESVTDRPTRSHEHVFLLAKSDRYFYDGVAIAEPSVSFGTVPTRAEVPGGDNQDRELAMAGVRRGARPCADRTRGARSVWTIASTPFAEAHFATFPVGLPLRCIRAGTGERGRCAGCGAPWRRVTARHALRRERPNEHVKRDGAAGTGNSCANTVAGVSVVTLGWYPSCRCGGMPPLPPWPRPPESGAHGEAEAEYARRCEEVRGAWRTLCAEAAGLATEPCLVLDPFSGAGTTGVAALQLGRAYVGIELNSEYAAMSARRIEREGRPGTARVEHEHEDAPLFIGNGAEPHGQA